MKSRNYLRCSPMRAQTSFGNAPDAIRPPPTPLNANTSLTIPPATPRKSLHNLPRAFCATSRPRTSPGPLPFVVSTWSSNIEKKAILD
ncbi:MAG: hypothetical protein BYD32DRAFT_279452 [Podila humilis]|nr:MAG: hypothetical protein BYD32DRAFT_279452 [Podila humilis]